MLTEQYFRGQGPILVAGLDANGNPLEFEETGDASGCLFSPSASVVSKQEHKSGLSREDNRFYHGLKVDLELDYESWLPDDIARYLWGVSTAKVAGSVSSETINGTLKQNAIYRLDNPNVSALVITDSAGTPKTLVAGTDYTENDVHGSFQLLADPTTLTAPLKASYSYGVSTDVGMMMSVPAEVWVRLEAVNSAAGGKPQLIEFYRCVFEPASNMGAISDTYMAPKLKGGALFASARPVDPILGQYGRVTAIG
ncbi:phage tail tube protein [Acidihalobacter prosperus]|uniref:Uncharacterized protein n=1 Tax=Acidihalobacter prosperus TaxID=160660 RepID=A0A1A6C8A5_9GAMM|nr:hypothetical protein [Acidihalobacter prosperus]OBS10786.1 hypothetical protein Thpro_020502 [Acidihalobacter prosperus]